MRLFLIRSPRPSIYHQLSCYVRTFKDSIRFGLSPQRRKHVYVDLHDPLFNKQYTYLLLKFFLIEGYCLVLRFRPSLILRFNALKYTEPIFSERSTYILPYKPGSQPFVSISDIPGLDKTISFNYFNAVNKPGRYVIPMTLHPLFYKKNIWNEDVPIKERVQAVFFAGNVEGKAYKESSHLARFGMRSRYEQIERLKEVNSLRVYERISGRGEHGAVYLIDRRDLGVGIDGWRELLAQFCFFLALPGQVMPFCHNIIEAMSVGTIPILHENYAKLFEPPLKDMQNAITYTESNLVEKLRGALELNREKLSQISGNTTSYYHNYLVPGAVVSNILSEDISELALCGEGDSVKLMEAGQ